MVNKPQTSKTAFKKSSSSSQACSSSSTQTSSASSQSSKSSKKSVKTLRRQFTVQFKLMAVRMYERLGSIRKAAKNLVITRKVLRNWIKIKVFNFLFFLINLSRIKKILYRLIWKIQFLRDAAIMLLLEEERSFQS